MKPQYYNRAKLDKALEALEMRAKYVNMDYYWPKVQKLCQTILRLPQERMR